jgi:hypothetical protein
LAGQIKAGLLVETSEIGRASLSADISIVNMEGSFAHVENTIVSHGLCASQPDNATKKDFRAFFSVHEVCALTARDGMHHRSKASPMPRQYSVLSKFWSPQSV